MVPPERSPRIAWFSPVDRAHDSLGAYCTSLLLPYLRERFTIEVFSDLSATPNLAVPHHHYLNAYKRHRATPFDLFFYMIEDGLPARFTRAHLGLAPGIVWLHDLLLSDLGAEAFHSSPWEYTIAQFSDLSAPFNPRTNPLSPVWPHAYREISLATTVLYSSPVALRDGAHIVTRRIESTPGSHGAVYLPPPIELSVPTEPPIPATPSTRTLRIAATSRPTVAGQMHHVLEALRSRTTPWHLDWLIDHTEHTAAAALLSEFNVAASVSVHLGRAPDRWRALLPLADATIHLHNEPFHHIAPYPQLALAAGRPVIVSGTRGREELPDDITFRIEPGYTVTAQLAAVFDTIVERGPAAIGAVGRAYIDHTSRADRIAARLADLFEAERPRHTSLLDRSRAVAENGLAGLHTDIAALLPNDRDRGLTPYESLISPLLSELS